MHDLSTEYNEVNTEYDDLSTKYNEVNTEYNDLSTKNKDASTEYRDQKYHKTVMAFHLENQIDWPFSHKKL